MLLSLGLSIIFGLMRVINLAHGEFMMVGAYTTFAIAESFKAWLPPQVFDFYYVLALPLAFLVAGAIGWICEVVVIRHLYGRPIETLLATWGISLLLIQSARLLFGDTTSFTPPGWLQGGWTVTTGLVLPLNRVFIIVFCAACVAVGVGTPGTSPGPRRSATPRTRTASPTPARSCGPGCRSRTIPHGARTGRCWWSAGTAACCSAGGARGCWR